MKLWQGWHNTDLGRSYFHYGPLGVQRSRWVYWHKHVKTWSKNARGKKWEMEKSEVGGFFFI